MRVSALASRKRARIYTDMAVKHVPACSDVGTDSTSPAGETVKIKHFFSYLSYMDMNIRRARFALPPRGI